MLGKVQIKSLIARGGMAEVYLGTHTTLQRDVAVKILRNQYEDDSDLLERFQREARVVAKLRHQNIVQVFDYDSVDEHPYIVMEFISGPSLSKYLGILHKNKHQLELPDINRILNGVANALQFAHNSGIVHRDIKPGNVILTSHTEAVEAGKPLPHDFEPVLTDFGLVRFLNSARQTSAGATAGTPAYMSPEQARGENTDGRTDIYSLGIVLYEMLAGKVPFDGETTMSILMKHITEPPPPIPSLSPQLQRVLDKALAKNRDQRFQRPIELAQAFNAITNLETERSTYMGMVALPEAELQNTASFPSVEVEPTDSKKNVKAPVENKPTRNWVTYSLGFAAIALLAVILLGARNFVLPNTNATPTLVPITATQEIPITAATNSEQAAAILHFHDKNAIMDQAVLEALALPVPPTGSQYEAWLAGPTDRISMGILEVDSSGKGSLTYTSSQNANLLALYDHAELILKPTSASASTSAQVAYSYTIPLDDLGSLRQLLVADANLPKQPALLDALVADTDLLAQNASDMLTAHTNGDRVGTKKYAEAVLNILAGSQSQDHKDWNNDKKILDPSLGFGFVQNGDSPGYLAAITNTTNLILQTESATESMLTHGAEVKTCDANISNWITALQTQAQLVLSATSPTEVDAAVKQAANLAKQIKFGADQNNDSISEPISGECGVITLYASVYDMADMPLFAGSMPLNPVLTSTPSPNGTNFASTPTRSGSGGGNNTSPTQKPGGGNNGNNNGGGSGKPRPTKKP